MKNLAESRAAGFPWGSNQPAVTHRVAVALTLAILAAVAHYFRAAENGGASDFTPLWNGARLLLDGQSPYGLIGPGKLIDSQTPLVYPAPALVAVAPFTLLTAHLAGTAFIFASTLLLAWGATENGWHRLPMFPSIAFLTSAQLGQWSILMTASVFIPVLAFFAIAKPQSSAPVVASSSSASVLAYAGIGSLILVVVSFWFVPGWPAEWWDLLGSSSYFVAPLFRFGGPAIALVLLRWRRAEAWMILIAACLPQTWYPYNGLLLLAVASTYREACFLSLFSSAAWVAVYLFFPGEMRSAETRELWGAVLVATSYLPAVLVVLRRRNEGPSPWWLSKIQNYRLPKVVR